MSKFHLVYKSKCKCAYKCYRKHWENLFVIRKWMSNDHCVAIHSNRIICFFYTLLISFIVCFVINMKMMRKLSDFSKLSYFWRCSMSFWISSFAGNLLKVKWFMGWAILQNWNSFIITSKISIFVFHCCYFFLENFIYDMYECVNVMRYYCVNAICFCYPFLLAWPVAFLGFC